MNIGYMLAEGLVSWCRCGVRTTQPGRKVCARCEALDTQTDA